MIKYYTLCSQGCCGSLHMVYCLEKSGLIRKRLDLSKQLYVDRHRRKPPKNYSDKILYMYGDPRNILLSSISKGGNNDWPWSHCGHVEGDAAYFNVWKKVTMQQILNDKYDPFKLQEHLMSWLNADIDYELMILKYEALEKPEIFQQVLEFFEIESEVTYDWRLRKTSYLNLPEEQQIQITELFKSLLDIQERLPSCFIRGVK